MQSWSSFLQNSRLWWKLLPSVSHNCLRSWLDCSQKMDQWHAHINVKLRRGRQIRRKLNYSPNWWWHRRVQRQFPCNSSGMHSLYRLHFRFVSTTSHLSTVHDCQHSSLTRALHRVCKNHSMGQRKSIFVCSGWRWPTARNMGLRKSSRASH